MGFWKTNKNDESGLWEFMFHLQEASQICTKPQETEEDQIWGFSDEFYPGENNR